jgi:hypothetical protein
LDRLFVVPAAKLKICKTPPPLMTAGVLAAPMIVRLFEIVGNGDPSVMTFVTVILISFFPGVTFA